jgi:hypothetical protein
MEDLARVKKDMDELEIVGYENYGLASPDSVKSTLAAIREYDKRFPIESEMERIREIALKRRK